MRDKIINHSEWLEQQPVFEGENKEVFENADGSQYIPVGIVEGLLDWCTEKKWETSKFQFSVLQIGGKTFVSGSVELSIAFPNEFHRSVVGCATVDVATMLAKDIYSSDNTDYEATILSLALCNAAKKLGNRFGRSLNGRGVGKVQDEKKESLTEIEKEISTVTKLMVDGKSYENAQTLFTVYPHLKNNTTLKILADSLPKYKK